MSITFLTVMLYIIPYFLIKNIIISQCFCNNFNNYISNFIYIVYLLISILVYNYFKNQKSLFSIKLMYSNHSQMEFIGLISIFLTSILRGYSTIQCIFNYMVHPYILGGKKLHIFNII